MTYIVIRRAYAHLEEELRRVFGRRADVEVIIDQRQGARRTGQQPTTVERRRTDRRLAKEELVEVLIVEGAVGPRLV